MCDDTMSAMVVKLTKLSSDNPKYVIPYMKKLVQNEFWRDHCKCISDIRKNWRRRNLPTLLRWKNIHDSAEENDDLLEGCRGGENSDQEVVHILGPDACVSGYMQGPDIRWRTKLYYDLKTYLIQQDHPEITQHYASTYAERSLSEMSEATKEMCGFSTDEPCPNFQTVMRGIDSMDREIKFRLFKWFDDKGLAYMYNPDLPYENVANYVILNEYDISNWDIIVPLLGKTHVNSYSRGHHDQLINLLRVLERMGKNSSYHALTQKRGGKIKKPKSTTRSTTRSTTKHKIKSKKWHS